MCGLCDTGEITIITKMTNTCNDCGILTGQIIGGILYLCKVRIQWCLDFIFLLLMFLDWFIQYKNIKESTNFRRLVTGNLAGIAQTSIVIKVILLLLSSNTVNFT